MINNSGYREITSRFIFYNTQQRLLKKEISKNPENKTLKEKELYEIEVMLAGLNRMLKYYEGEQLGWH